ncbi:MAG: hypothetical protein EOQ64_03600 [Mesorhizobium sp.]|uniref:hypothetical protein n=1 Tax=Mesorhizobium sp. TaxID=1871066 RepID=UPI000FE745A0|nr:hypothetical protein [Mesorhizobium sp.]RWG59787.1 MAG: hypothetical protein EOQ64_03600 [Mesorhizobium sp.]RWH46414.1 MAG: hypothetical protein EOQ78_03820 [Mesorhizobium sp.]RWI25875.1 MAG: hypothetical protein EOQ94_09830 [Mesorhizobium sp.]
MTRRARAGSASRPIDPAHPDRAGRGSYVRAGSICLAEPLRRYDLAEGHKTMTREAVIAAFA